METIAQLVTVGVAMLIVSSCLACGAKRHIVCVAIMQVVLIEIRNLTLTDLWTTSQSTIHFGLNPRLSIFLNCENSGAAMMFGVNLKHTYCDFYAFRKTENRSHPFSVSCPAQYFDLKFLGRTIRQYERWMQEEPSICEYFYFPPTELIMSTDVDRNMSVPSDPGYSEERRLAKRESTVRHPILEY